MSLLRDILNNKINTNNKEEDNKRVLNQILNHEINTEPTSFQTANAPRKANLNFVTNSEQKAAAEALLKSRKKYSDFLQNQTKETRSKKLALPESPLNFSDRRNQLEELASQNAMALREASQSEEGMNLRREMRENQNVYNYTNYLKNKQEVENKPVSTIEKIINPIVSNAVDLVDPGRLTGTLTYFDDEGNRSYLPNKRELRQQKVRQESKGAVGVYNDMVSSFTKAATAKALNLVTGGMGGDLLYYGNIMDSNTDEALKQGYSNEEALTYGLTTTLTAKTLDNVLNTFGGLSNVTKGKIPTLERATDKLLGKFLKNKVATVILSNFTREGLSEFAEEFVDNYSKYIINSDKSDSDSLIDVFFDTLPSAGYAYLVGGLSGVVGGTVELNSVDTQERIQALNDYKNDLDNLKPNTPIEAEFKNDEINKVEDKLMELDSQQEETNVFKDMTNEDLQELKNTFDNLKLDTNDIDNELKLRNETTENISEQTQEDANIQENAPTVEQDATVQETPKQPEIKLSSEKKKENQYQFNFDETNNYKTLAQENNYNKQQTYVAEKMQNDVISISKNKEDAKQLSVMTSPPAKTQQTTTINTLDGNNTKHYNPSQTVAEQGNSAIYQNVRNRVTSSQEKIIDTQNKKVSQTILKDIEKFKKEGNNILADSLEEDLDSYTYTVENMGDKSNKNYHSLLLKLKSGETDVETTYKNLKEEYNTLIESGEWNKIDPVTGNAQQKLEWEYKVNALLKLLERDKTGSYKHIIKDFDYINKYGIRHTSAQDLAMASVEHRRNPNYINDFAENRLTNMYERELKHHSNDAVWEKENNPYDLTNNSPYRFTDEEYDFLTKLTSELKNIDRKTDNETFQTKLNEIDNFVGEAMTKRLRGMRGAGHTAKNALINLIKQNNLLSVHVGFTNISGNVVDTIGLNKITRFGTNIAEKSLSKKTGFKTNQYTRQGKSIYRKGLMEGLNNVGKEFISGVKISDMNTKYTINGEIDYSKIGSLNYKTRAKTGLGKILTSPINAEGRLVTGWLSLGDTPKSTAVRNESLFNQLHQEAIRTSIKTGKDSIFYTLNNEKAGNTTFYYTDTEGNIQRKTFPIKEANSFLVDRNQIEATETMIDIAREDGEKAVYTGQNALNDKARKWVDALNSTVPGLGDVTLQFTNVANNMAVETYRHSPVAIPELISKTKTLKKNTLYVEKQIDAYIGKGKDFTTTKEYQKIMNQNYKLQHDLGVSYGKVLAGTVVDSLIILAAANGLVTGDVDKEDEEKGMQDYSVKIGDKYYSYDFGVFGMVAKSGSVTYNAFSGDKNILGNSMSLMKGYGDSILEQSFIKNLTDTFMTKYGDTWEDKFADLGVNLMSSLTTPGFVKEISLAADNYTSRSTYSNDKWEYLANRLNANWNRDALPKKLDGWGNTMKKGSTLIDSAWNTFFKSDFMSTLKNDKVSEELADVYQMTGEHNVLPLKSNGSYKNSVNQFTYKKNKYVLTDKEKEQFAETYGKSAHSNMEKLIKSSMYKQADYDTKVKYIEEIYDNARDEAKKQYLETKGVDYYNTGQKVLILGQDDRFEQAPIVDAIESGISYQSAKGKINDPQKYKYATTIAKDYEIYTTAQEELKQIKELYPGTTDRKNAYIDYVNTFSKLSSVEKAMLIKTEYSSLYKSYDNQIKEYLKSKGLSEEEYQYALKQMGIKEKNK